MALTPARGPHTKALREFLATATGLPVGGGVAPPGAGWQGAPGQSSFVAYLVVHDIPGGAMPGSLGRGSTEAQLLWQVDACGATQVHALDTLDPARDALCDPTRRKGLIVPDRIVTFVEVDIPAGTARQDPDQPSIFRTFERFKIWTTRSSS